MVLTPKNSTDALKGQVGTDRIFMSISGPVKHLHLGQQYHCVAVLGLGLSAWGAAILNCLLDVSPDVRCIISVQEHNFLGYPSTFVLLRSLGVRAGLLQREFGVVFAIKMLKTSSRVETLLGNAVKVLLVSLRPDYVNHLVKVVFACLFLVSFALFSKYAVVTNLFVLDARKLASKLFILELTLLPLEMIASGAFEVF